MSFSIYMEFRILQGFFNQLHYPDHSPHWIGLCTAQPEEDGSDDHEVSGGGYTRFVIYSIDWNTPNFDAGLKSYADNKNVLTFDKATGDWGTVTHFALWTAEVAGVLLLYGRLVDSEGAPAPKDILLGSVPCFEANTLKVTMD